MATEQSQDQEQEQQEKELELFTLFNQLVISAQKLEKRDDSDPMMRFLNTPIYLSKPGEPHTLSGILRVEGPASTKSDVRKWTLAHTTSPTILSQSLTDRETARIDDLIERLEKNITAENTAMDALLERINSRMPR